MALVNAVDAPSNGKVISCLEATISLSPSASSIKALSSLCLYGLVVAPMPVDVNHIVDFASKIWNKKVVVFELSDVLSRTNRFKLGFECEDDRKWALDNGHWSFRRYTFALRAWLPSVEGSTPSDTFCLWVQIHNLPDEFFSVDNGNRLGGLVGKVIKVELEEDNLSSWNIFLRVVVEVNLMKPLVSGCFFDLDSGIKHWLQFKYEKIGIFCYYCGRFGHQRRGCSLSSPITVENIDDVPTPMYGPWMSIASKFHDIFSGTSLKNPTAAISGSGGYRRLGSSSVPRLAGAGTLGKNSVEYGPRWGKMLMDRAFSGNGQKAEIHWVPKKVADGVLRQNAENGNMSIDILNGEGKSPAQLPISKELTVGVKEAYPLVLNKVTAVEKPLDTEKGLSVTVNLSSGNVVGSIGPKDGSKALKSGHVGKSCGLLGLGREGRMEIVENFEGPKDNHNDGSILTKSKLKRKRPGEMEKRPRAINEKCDENMGSLQPGPNLLEGSDRGLSQAFNGNEKGLPKDGNQQVSGEGRLVVPSFDEETALSQFFNAQEELLHDLKHFGKLDLYEIKKIGGDIGVPTASDTNERTTPFKKRKFEGSASLCTRPHKTIGTHPDVVRDFPWDTKEKDRESKGDMGGDLVAFGSRLGYYCI
ncbi:hypothetical protein G4B88_009411 [Cannabis sativa]|uniref:CCHC-type domain-containing protein n=1 Tax=Cannabis sativa TaxID=3483 RepID=A0A7J6GGM8_CANSA|nr:hypothetical protein G4B88_009411 [Cannabis sativa]